MAVVCAPTHHLLISLQECTQNDVWLARTIACATSLFILGFLAHSYKGSSGGNNKIEEETNDSTKTYSYSKRELKPARPNSYLTWLKRKLKVPNKDTEENLPNERDMHRARKPPERLNYKILGGQNSPYA